MNTRDIKEFANRDWSIISDLDRAYWAAEFQRNGAASSRSASQALWLHMKSIRPEWPSLKERNHDLENHIALKQLLDRIGNDFSPR